MKRVISDIKTESWWARIFLLASIVSGCALAFISELSESRKALMIAGFYLSFSAFLAPSILRAARSGHEHIVSVCIWSGVLMVTGIICFYWAFFSLSLFNDSSYEKILNIIPVLVGAWAAGTGWFIHYQLTSKANRVKHALDLVMETKKNSEFRKLSELASKHFPPGSQIDECYVKYFSNKSLMDIEKENASKAGRISEAEIEKAKAVMALKYVLNYYELMAIGIRKNELDEDLIYQAMSTTIAGTFRRAKKFVDYCIEKDPLTYRDIAQLSDRWEKKLEEDRIFFKRTTLQR